MVDLLNQVLTWRINPYHFLPLALLLLWLEEADDTHPVTNLLSAGHINHLPPGFESVWKPGGFPKSQLYGADSV